MRVLPIFLGLVAAGLAGSALANDSMATLGAGGLEFITTDKVEMASEDLSISPTKVTVVYKFKNDADTDQHVLVAFPMPDITGDGDFTVGIPTDDPQNIFGFKTTFDGKPVDAVLHQNAFAVGIDETDYLKKLGVPLAPFGDATQKAVDALSDADHQRMLQLGLVIPMTYDAGKGEQTDYTPVWTLRSTYSWEADFPAGKTVTVVHTYTPSLGGTVATTFLAPPSGSDDEDRPAEYKKKYCTDDGLHQDGPEVAEGPERPLQRPLCRELALLCLVDRGQLERADPRFPPDHRQGRSQGAGLVLLGWQGDQNRSHHLLDERHGFFTALRS